MSSAMPVHDLLSSAQKGIEGQTCRGCGNPLSQLFVDLGLSPLCESLVLENELNAPEKFYPLQAFVCTECWLVQLKDHVSGEEIFDDSYAYYSSISSSWLDHCRRYADMIVPRLSLGPESMVVEVASNDGYLLKNFVEREIPCVGIEPAETIANVANERGVPTRAKYFGESVAESLKSEGIQADLMVGNNVLAHVPDLHDFLAGFKLLLAPEGTITFEFPHLLQLIQQRQFDTIYQEHYCYFSLMALEPIFRQHSLRIYDVESLPTHGGSLRVFACHESFGKLATTSSVASLLELERKQGLTDLKTYQGFADAVSEVRWQLLQFLFDAKRTGKLVLGYGAPGKGNTLLNYCGIREDLLPLTVDRNQKKQGTYLVGSRIPVHDPEIIRSLRPDYLLVLPWNLRTEITQQMSFIREWGGKFVFPIPKLDIC